MTQDRQLQEAVLAEFLWEPSINAAHIGVVADKGVVTLTGHVGSYLEKSAAERAARKVRGVLAIAEEIKVLLPVETERTDAAIAHAAIDRIAWEASVPADSVQVKVEDGWVTLTGELNWHYQRVTVERVIAGLRGVVGITNLTSIRVRPNVVNIGHDIGAALHRSWFDPSTVNVSVAGNKVTLSGTVHTPGDKWKAASTAWGSPGTMEVENDLVVTG
jgi:osmotically-inducible protein OsmY